MGSLGLCPLEISPVDLPQAALPPPPPACCLRMRCPQEGEGPWPTNLSLCPPAPSIPGTQSAGCPAPPPQLHPPPQLSSDLGQ